MFKKTYREWASQTNERQKLQSLYAAVALLSLLVAGIVGLLERDLGMSILNVAYVASLIWVVNFVVWAIFLATQNRSVEAPATKTRSTRKK